MLSCRNIVANGRRTSMRLDKETWNALSDICRRENTTLYKLCSLIDASKGSSGLSAATRLFVLAYYRRSVAKYEIGASHRQILAIASNKFLTSFKQGKRNPQYIKATRSP